MQDILDLLATTSSDTERQILDDWKNMFSQYTIVYDVSHATGMSDMQTMFLTLKGRSLRNGATFTSSVPLFGATDMQAGVMNIKEFYEDNIGKAFTGIISNALDNYFGRNH